MGGGWQAFYNAWMVTICPPRHMMAEIQHVGAAQCHENRKVGYWGIDGGKDDWRCRAGMQWVILCYPMLDAAQATN